MGEGDLALSHNIISQCKAEIVNGYLQVKNAEEFQDEDHTISHMVVFPDGKEMWEEIVALISRK